MLTRVSSISARSNPKSRSRMIHRSQGSPLSIIFCSIICVIILLLHFIECDKGPSIIVLGGSGSNSGGIPSIIQTGDGGGGGGGSSSGGFLSGLTSSLGVLGRSSSGNNNAQSSPSPLTATGHPNVLVLGSDSSGSNKGSNKKSNVIIIMQPPNQQQQQQQQNQQSGNTNNQQSFFSPEMMYQTQNIPSFQMPAASYAPTPNTFGQHFMPQYAYPQQGMAGQHQYYTTDGSTLTRRGGNGHSSFFPQPPSELMASGSSAHPFPDSESLMKLLQAYGNSGSTSSPSSFSPSFASPSSFPHPSSFSNQFGYKMVKGGGGAGGPMYPVGSNSHSRQGYPWPGMAEQYNSLSNPFSSSSSSPSSLLTSSQLSASLPSSLLTPSFLHHSSSPSSSSNAESPTSSDLSDLLAGYSV